MVSFYGLNRKNFTIYMGTLARNGSSNSEDENMMLELLKSPDATLGLCELDYNILFRIIRLGWFYATKKFIEKCIPPSWDVTLSRVNEVIWLVFFVHYCRQSIFMLTLKWRFWRNYTKVKKPHPNLKKTGSPLQSHLVSRRPQKVSSTGSNTYYLALILFG